VDAESVGGITQEVWDIAMRLQRLFCEGEWIIAPILLPWSGVKTKGLEQPCQHPFLNGCF